MACTPSARVHRHFPGDSSAVGAAQAVQKDESSSKDEVPMSPFVAALVACGYMASVFVVFLVLRPGRHASELHHP
jgi:hypothetical protein